LGVDLVISAHLRLGSLIAMAAFASPALAGLLPEDEVTEMMMEMENVTAISLARYFPPTQVSNLSFTNEMNVAAKTLSFQLVPASVYEGMPVTINAVAAFDNGDSKWHLTSHVAASTFAWQITGTAGALPPPDPFDPPFEGQFIFGDDLFPLPSPPNPTPFDISSEISYTNTAAQTISEATIHFSQFGINVAQATVFDRLILQGPEKGKWQWDLPAATENGNAFRVDAQGITPLLDGPGTSTIQIAPVPEPAAFLLAAVALWAIYPSRLRGSVTARRNSGS
jgi:hypothetical protein